MGPFTNDVIHRGGRGFGKDDERWRRGEVFLAWMTSSFFCKCFVFLAQKLYQNRLFRAPNILYCMCYTVLLLWSLDKFSSPKMSPLQETPLNLQGPPYSRANFQLRVYKHWRTLLEYLSTVLTNLQMSGDSQRALGDYLGDYFGEYLQEYIRKISWNLWEVSWNLWSVDLWKRSRDTPKVSLELYRPSVERWHY